MADGGEAAAAVVLIVGMGRTLVFLFAIAGRGSSAIAAVEGEDKGEYFMELRRGKRGEGGSADCTEFFLVEAFSSECL